KSYRISCLIKISKGSVTIISDNGIGFIKLNYFLYINTLYITLIINKVKLISSGVPNHNVFWNIIRNREFSPKILIPIVITWNNVILGKCCINQQTFHISISNSY